jgi:hypothetical protein
LPDNIESAECLQFLGLAPEVAAAVYRNYVQGKQDLGDPADILEYAVGHVQHCGYDAVAGDTEKETIHEWHLAMASMGVCEELRHRILSPGFEKFRTMETARHWVIDTMRTTYRFLMSVNDRVLETCATPTNNVFGPRVPPARPIDTPLKAVPPPGASAPSARRPPIGLFAPPPPSPVVATIAETLRVEPHERILFHGSDFEKLRRAIGANGCLHLQKTLSEPPTDYSSVLALGYFTKQRWAALEYAKWVRQRQMAGTASVGIMTLIVPQSLLADAGEIVGDHLLEFAWHNRLEKELPQHLRFYEDYNVLMGPIVKNCSQQVGRHSSWNSLELMKHETTGKCATQVVFNTQMTIPLRNSSRCCVANVSAEIGAQKGG